MNVSYRHESVQLTGRWDTRDEGVAVTTTAGSYFEFAFEGSMALLRFDVVANAYPRLHLWIQVDGGVRTEAPIDSHLRIVAPTDGRHICRVIYKGGSEKDRRWFAPLTGKVSFLGVQTERPIPIEQDTRPIVEFVGDSITEGVMIDADFDGGTDPVAHVDECKRCYQDDVCATYAWLTAQALNLRSIFMGYGAVGVTCAGCGGVPNAVEAYPCCFDGSPISHAGVPRYIVVNHGTNDRTQPVDLYLQKYEALLDVIRSHQAQAEIIALSPFCGAFHRELGEMLAAYERKHDCRIWYIDTNGWIPARPIHPTRAGHRRVAEKLIPLLQTMING